VRRKNPDPICGVGVLHFLARFRRGGQGNTGAIDLSRHPYAELMHRAPGQNHDHSHGNHQQGHAQDRQHNHVEFTEADWARWADITEREGEILGSIFHQAMQGTITTCGILPDSVRAITDIGSGPGVGTCDLARLFPNAMVTAVDSSAAMLERVTERALAQGVANRVTTLLTEMPSGFGAIPSADLIWASMSLHHIGNEVESLRLLRNRLNPNGILVIAEFGDATRIFPSGFAIGGSGFVDRVDHAMSSWFTAMRAGLPGSTTSDSLESMVTSAGYSVVDSSIVHLRADAPLPEKTKEFLQGYLERVRTQLNDFLDHADLATLDLLLNDEDSNSATNRDEMILYMSRQIVIARPAR
jgi:SAM-dependent methyltransferase